MVIDPYSPSRPMVSWINWIIVDAGENRVTRQRQHRAVVIVLMTISHFGMDSYRSGSAGEDRSAPEVFVIVRTGPSGASEMDGHVTKAEANAGTNPAYDDRQYQ